jgi:hypothetical protein
VDAEEKYRRAAEKRARLAAKQAEGKREEWTKLDSNEEFALWQNRDGLQVCLSMGTYPTPDSGYGIKPLPEPAGTWELGKRRGFKRKGGFESYGYEPRSKQLAAAAPSEPSKVEQAKPWPICPTCGCGYNPKNDRCMNCFCKTKPTEDCVWDSEKYNGNPNWPSLDERIAAAREQLSRPVKRSRFDPTPWQEWPMGGEDEP